MKLGHTIARVSLDSTEMGGRAKMSMNARPKHTTAVSMQYAPMPLDPTIAPVFMDTKAMVGHVKM